MEKTRSKRVSVVLTVLFIALLLLAVAVMFFALFGKENDDKPRSVEEMSATLKRTPDYGKNYIDSIVFLGDASIYSITDSELGVTPSQVWCDRNGGLPLTYNTYCSPVITDQNEEVIADAVTRYSPKYLVITLGHENGIEFCGEQTFKDYYSKLVSEIKQASPETNIILQSVLPVSKTYAKENRGYTPEKIRSASLWICELAEAHGVRFLNTSSVLCDDDGYLLSEYSDGNGINTKGYEKIIEYIRTHGYR